MDKTEKICSDKAAGSHSFSVSADGNKWKHFQIWCGLFTNKLNEII